MNCKKCGRDTWVGVETWLCDDCKLPKSSAMPSSRKTMIPEQIKQTVAEIRERAEKVERHNAKFYRCPRTQADKDRAQLLEITDHLQKTIEAQGRVGAKTLLALVEARGEVSDRDALLHEIGLKNQSHLAKIEALTRERDEARELCGKYRDNVDKQYTRPTILPWEARNGT